jgi:hypothetical protein
VDPAFGLCVPPPEADMHSSSREEERVVLGGADTADLHGHIAKRREFLSERDLLPPDHLHINLWVLLAHKRGKLVKILEPADPSRLARLVL